jgi:hypothetical protein
VHEKIEDKTTKRKGEEEDRETPSSNQETEFRKNINWRRSSAENSGGNDDPLILRGILAVLRLL